MYNNIRVSVLAVVTSSSGLVLLVLRKTGPESNCWDLPGGGLQPGEKLQEALAREIHEETGMNSSQYEVLSLLSVEESFFPDWKETGLHSLNIIYECSVDKYKLTLLTNEQAEIEEVRWFKPEDLQSITCTKRTSSALSKVDIRSPN